MRELERKRILPSGYYLTVFGASLLVLILSLRKLQGFILYCFLEENICVHCLMCLIVVLVILSVKIIRLYCLNDKNLTRDLPNLNSSFNPYPPSSSGFLLKCM